MGSIGGVGNGVGWTVGIGAGGGVDVGAIIPVGDASIRARDDDPTCEGAAVSAPPQAAITAVAAMETNNAATPASRMKYLRPVEIMLRISDAYLGYVFRI